MTTAHAPGRRAFLKTAAGAATAAPLPAFYIGTAAAQQAVKIGMVIAKQGPFAQQGADLAHGAQIAFAESGAKILGRTAELEWLDEANPQGAVQSISKLVEEERVLAVLGGTSSATTLAMGQVALRAKVPFISVNGAAREITGKDCNPFMFRSPASVPVYADAMAQQMLAVGKKWYFIAGAFAFGEDVITTFSDILKAAGGTVLGADRVPVGTTDYSSFVLKARAAKPDVVISGAANVEPLLKQFKELGLTGNLMIAGPAITRALEEVKIQDGATAIQYRKGDHQLMRRLVVANARKPNPADKWDVLDIKSSTVASQAALERMYGVPAELGCKMAPVA